MVTISLTRIKRRPFSGLIWRILLAFLLIVGFSFIFMGNALTNLVSNYLYTQRIRQDSLSVEKLATSVAPLFQSGPVERLTEALNAAAGEMGGRLLVLDTDGKVQADSFGRLYGMRLQAPEVLRVLADGEPKAYGIHTLAAGSAAENLGEGRQVSYCTAVLTGTRGTLGVLFYAGTVDELAAELANVESRMMTIFGVVAAGALLAALFVSRILTRPISALTDTIRRMGKGDLSVRARVGGSGEMRELAESYNVMAEQLEHLDKSRSRFVSNASHELKTPLAALKVSLETMIYQPDMPEELRTEFMTDMNKEIDRLTAIIEDLLTLSRLDSGDAGGLHRVQTDLTGLAVTVVRKLRPIAERKGQTIETELQSGLSLLADGPRLEQVFSNLIDNAIKYTPAGGKITVRLHKRGGELVWSVQDTGIGIPKADQPHVFDRFYRVSESRERTTGGTGLGLSIARQLVRMHGGSITVESEEGKGTTFTVVLPQQTGEVRS